WIAYRSGRPVGRISAQIDRLQREPVGLFGSLDAADDPAVVRSLLHEVEQWHSARNRKTIRGPFTLSINGESGVMIEGQSARSMTMMPWHPPYLARHVSAADYADVKTLLSYTIKLHGVHVPDLMTSVRTPALRESIRVRGLNLNDLASEAKILVQVFNDAWRD